MAVNRGVNYRQLRCLISWRLKRLYSLMVLRLRILLRAYLWRSDSISKVNVESGRSIVLEERLVVPFEELLDLWRGGAVYKGGVVEHEEEAIPQIWHYRGNEMVSEKLYVEEDSVCLQGTYYWCGPLVDHFGHMVAEFSGRILRSSIAPENGILLFCRKKGVSQNELGLLKWQQELIEYLNPGRKEVYVAKQSVRVERLIVYSSEQFLYRMPSMWYLSALGVCQQTLSKSKNGKYVYVSRSKYARCNSSETMNGGYAGERQVEHILRTAGYFVMHPEEFTLRDQLSVARDSKFLVVAEGSFLHALELLGHRPNTKLVVIARRPAWGGLDASLRARFKVLVYIDCVEGIYCMENYNPRVKGLAALNISMLLRGLEAELGIKISREEESSVRRGADVQIAKISGCARYFRREDLPTQSSESKGW